MLATHLGQRFKQGTYYTRYDVDICLILNAIANDCSMEKGRAKQVRSHLCRRARKVVELGSDNFAFAVEERGKRAEVCCDGRLKLV